MVALPHNIRSTTTRPAAPRIPHPSGDISMLTKKLICTLALGLAAMASHAQTWPTKPVTLLVPFPAGGSTDMVARALSTKLGTALNQTFVVDNKAGATGTIGATMVKRAPADGSMFLVTSLGPLVIAPH